MRIANENGIDLERKHSNKLPLKKYFIVTEGDKTEQQYFKGIDECKEELGINSLIEICVVENEEDEHGHSHPLKKLTNFKNSIEEEKFMYYNGLDKVYFIIDRDPKNFFPDQFEEFLKKCLESGYYVCISNPTFEVFLLMHSDRVFELDNDEMLKNEYVTASERFLEKKLKEFFDCKKTKLNFNNFKFNIDKAIINEKSFSEDIRDLKDNLGSNVGKLIEDMKSPSSDKYNSIEKIIN